jgi:hypothetical protein
MILICILTYVELLGYLQPYESDEVEPMNLSPICKQDQELWRGQLPLICYYIVEWHLSSRVLRQFGKL